MPTYQLDSLETTDTFGRLMGTNLSQGCILLLTGNLGAGKTTLTKSICAGLGIDPDIVISPTYTMVNIYEGQWPIHHVDLYRLTEPDELDAFDREDLISDEGITLVEWPQLLEPLLLSEPRLALSLETLDENSRQLDIQPMNDTFESLFQALKPYEHTRP